MLKKVCKKHLILLTVITLAVTIAVTSAMSVAAAVATQNSAQAEVSSPAASGEIIMPNGDVLVADSKNGNLDISTLKAVDVFIQNGSSKQKVKMAKGTVADALTRAKLILGANQAVTPLPDAAIEENMIIKISDGAKVNITADGKSREVVVPLGTVDQALKALGYTIGKDDICSVDFDSLVAPGMDIVLQRVTFGEETTQEEIPFDTVSKPDSSLDEGETRVETPGVNGLKEVTKKVRYIDGKAEDYEVISETVIKDAEDEVVLEGQSESARTFAPFETSSSGGSTFTDQNGNTIAYTSMLTGSGSAYTAAPGAGTATGVPAYFGGVAVNPNIIPYGTRLYIESTDGSYVYGYATAVDTGGALMDGSAIVDLYYPTYDQCVNFGRRNVNIYVLA